MEYLIGVVSMFILIVLITAIFGWWDSRNEKKEERAAFDKSDFINEIKRFEPKEGDTIVIRTPYTVKSDEIRQEIKKSYEKFLNLGPKFRIIILQHGEDIETHRPIISEDTENKTLGPQ